MSRIRLAVAEAMVVALAMRYPPAYPEIVRALPAERQTTSAIVVALRWSAVVLLVACGPPVGITSTEESSTASETQPPIDNATCSDGVVASHEPCDDANDIPGDGCNPGCLLSGVEMDFTLWGVDWTPTSIAIDSAEMVWIAGYSGNGSFLATVDEQRGVLSQVTLDNVDAARMTFTPGGQIVVAGTRDGRTYVERRTRGGTLQWSTTSDDAFDIYDISVTHDRILLTGASWPHDAAKQDVHVVVFDGDGERLWSAGYNGPYDGTQLGREIMADGAGDVYVVGVDRATRAFDDAAGGANDTDVWLRKYSAAGEMLWTQHHDGLAGDIDEPLGAALSPDGDVLVVGYETKVDDAMRTLELTTRVAPNGAPWWTVTRDRGASVSSLVRCAAFSDNGDAVIAGTITGVSGNRYFVSRIDPAGTPLWELEHPTSGNDVGPFDIAIAPETGDVVVLGYDEDEFGGVMWVWRTSA